MLVGIYRAILLPSRWCWILSIHSMVASLVIFTGATHRMALGQLHALGLCDPRVKADQCSMGRKASSFLLEGEVRYWIVSPKDPKKGSRGTTNRPKPESQDKVDSNWATKRFYRTPASNRKHWGPGLNMIRQKHFSDSTQHHAQTADPSWLH